ncbi:MAG: RodZ domain-containing protein [Pseudomonadota bacterium]
MESFGEYLKRERVSRGISLEEISATTRVRKIFLEALERDDLGKLPAQVFVKGFLQAYAKYVGLDQEEVVARYRNYVNSVKKGKESELPLPEKALLSKPLLAASAVAAICIVFAIVYFNPGKNEEVKTDTVPVSKPLEKPALPDIESSPPPALPKEAEKSVVTEDKSPEEPAPIVSLTDEAKPSRSEGEKVKPPEEEKTLSVKTSELTWLRIQIDDNEPYEVTLRPGENLTWKSLHTFKLLIGNAGGIDLFYNGEALGKLGNSGQVVSLTLPKQKLQ